MQIALRWPYTLNSSQPNTHSVGSYSFRIYMHAQCSQTGIRSPPELSGSGYHPCELKDQIIICGGGVTGHPHTGGWSRQNLHVTPTLFLSVYGHLYIIYRRQEAARKRFKDPHTHKRLVGRTSWNSAGVGDCVMCMGPPDSRPTNEVGGEKD